MAFVNAENQGWDTSKINFDVVNTIDGAVKALTDGTADYFMWERFMTKPLVDKGVFRRVDDCPTPWPCFVIAIRNEILESNPRIIKTVLEVINNKTKTFKDIPGIEVTLAERYNQKQEDIQEWLTLTEWSQKKLDKDTFEKVQEQLARLNIIEEKTAFEEIVG